MESESLTLQSDNNLVAQNDRGYEEGQLGVRVLDSWPKFWCAHCDRMIGPYFWNGNWYRKDHRRSCKLMLAIRAKTRRANKLTKSSGRCLRVQKRD